MARIAWVEDTDADQATAQAFEEVRRRRTRVPPVMRTMSLRPDVMVLVAQLADVLHFSDGHLDRRTKERIATYVSALNSCGYCATSHRVFLEATGERPDVAGAVEAADLPATGYEAKLQGLLELVGTQTTEPSAISDEQVAAVRDLGWSDPEIAEALMDGALFNFFNRMVEAFGLTAADFIPMVPDAGD